MKKIGLVITMLVLSGQVNAEAKVSIEHQFKLSCKTGGCELLCKTQSGPVYTKLKDAKSILVNLYASGSVLYSASLLTSTEVAIIPTGTETCKVTNAI